MTPTQTTDIPPQANLAWWAMPLNFVISIATAEAPKLLGVTVTPFCQTLLVLVASVLLVAGIAIYLVHRHVTLKALLPWLQAQVPALESRVVALEKAAPVDVASRLVAAENQLSNLTSIVKENIGNSGIAKAVSDFMIQVHKNGGVFGPTDATPLQPNPPATLSSNETQAVPPAAPGAPQ